jgi:hypothetical protein
VEFWFDRSAPYGAPRLLRLPGVRKIEPQAGSERKAAPIRAVGKRTARPSARPFRSS